MSDMISRQAAIDALWHSIEDECGELRSYAEAIISDAEDAIKALSGWIPTSVRLPEDNEEVLFCDNEGERWLGWHYGFWKTERLDFDEDEVVAWMPLPTPYRKGEPNE